MATIKEINEAIETLMSECNMHKMCIACPMHENCSRIFFDNGCISNWEKIKDGDIEKTNDAPTFDLPVAHGQWIHTGLTNVYGGHQHKCSVCGYELMVSPMCDNEKYCCNCGSKMDEVGEHDA